MKVNLSIEINDQQRNALATLMVSKETKRLATRDEVREYVEGCVDSLRDRTPADTTTLETVAFLCSPAVLQTTGDLRRLDLLRVDPEDAEVLAGKEPGFIIGWNRVKRREK